MKRLVFSLALLGASLIPVLAHAGTVGVSFGSTPTTFTPGLTATRGWAFDVLAPLTVTQLGMYDEASTSGFAEAHEVGIWDATGSTLLASVTMPSGTSAVVGPDGFRYLDLGSPLGLSVGSYLIGVLYPAGSADQIAQSAGPVGAAGFVAWTGSRLSPGASFSAPTSISAVPEGAFGPNFQFTSTTVPEPSGLVLVAAGVLAIALRRRKARA